MTAQVKFLQSSVFTPPPRGFELRSDGVWRETERKNDEVEWVWLCSTIRVLALSRDTSGSGWGRFIEVVDPDENTHTWAFPASMFAGDGTELRAGLLNMGLTLAPGKAAREALMRLLTNWQPDIRAITTDRLGWADDACTAFILGDGRVIGDNQVVYQQDHVPAAVAEMKQSGTLGSWRTGVAQECSGNPLMIMAVSLALAGPLLEPLGMDGGGIHLRGASSRGKSTILRVGVSVWGAPGFMNSWRATANGLEGVASACNGSLLALDELGEVSAREAGQAAYMLANGTGKVRANRSGMARPTKRWRVMVLSSGEITLADKMAEVGGRTAAGQAVRLLDIAADTGAHGAFDTLHDALSGAAFSDRLREATAKNHGVAGPAFVRKFLQDPEGIKEEVRGAIADFRKLANERFGASEDGQLQRAIARLGLIAAAGELATQFELTGWQKGDAQNAALDTFSLWLDGRGGSGPSEARDALERVRYFLTAHGGTRFERIDEFGNDRPIINRAGWLDGGTYYIAQDAWKEIHKGSDPVRAARHLRDAGFLTPGEGGNLAFKMPRKVSGRPRAYAVSEKIMGWSAKDMGSDLEF